MTNDSPSNRAPSLMRSTLAPSSPAPSTRVLASLFAALLVVATGSFAQSFEFHERAAELAANGDVASAIIEAKNQLQSTPDFLPSRLLLGELYLLAGEAAAAQTELRHALQAGADPNAALEPFLRALFSQYQFDAILREPIPPGASRSTLAAIHGYRGEAELGLNRVDRAREEFAAANAAQPGALAAYLGEARIAMGEGKVSRARERATAARQAHPADPEPAFFLGELAREQGNLDTALSEYEAAISLDPKHYPALVAHAAVLATVGRTEDAMAALSAVRENFPHEPRPEYLVSLIAKSQGDLVGAKTSLDRAYELIRLLPETTVRGHGSTLLLAGMVSAERADWEQADSFLTRYVSRYPNHFGARVGLAKAKLAQGRARDALDELATVDSGNSMRPDVLRVTAAARHAISDVPGALAAVDALLTHVPNDVWALDLQARLRHSQGNLSGAVAALEAAHALTPRSTDATITLARLLLEAGRAKRALTLTEDLVAREPTNPHLWSVRGVAFLHAKQFAKSAEALDTAIRLEPDELQPQLNRARLDMAMGRFDEAKDRLLILRGEREPDIRILRLLANIAERQNDRAAAVQRLNEAEELTLAKERDAVRKLGLLIADGAFQAAHAAARKLVALNSSSFEGHTALAVSALALGRRDEAQRVLPALKKLAEGEARKLLRVGDIYQRLRMPESAVALLRDAYQLAPNDPAIASALVDGNIVLYELAEALQIAEQTAERHPSSIRAQWAYARALGALGAVDDAASVYAAIGTATDRGAVIAYNGRRSLGLDAEALQGLRGFVAGHPTAPVAKSTLAERLIADNEFEEAAELLQQLVDEFPNEPILLNNLAWTHERLGKTASARSLAERAVSLRPDDPLVLDTLAMVLISEGRPLEALRHLRTAESKDSENPSIRLHIARALVESGDPERAAPRLDALWSEAEHLSPELRRRLTIQRGRAISARAGYF